MHQSASMQSYIYKEVHRPCKQWIHEVLLCRRETERVKLRTRDFVLLPDVDCVSKRSKRADMVLDPPSANLDMTVDIYPTENKVSQLIHGTDILSSNSFTSGQGAGLTQPLTSSDGLGRNTYVMTHHKANESTERPWGKWNPASPVFSPSKTGNFWQQKEEIDRRQWRMRRISQPPMSVPCFHWLAVVTDTNIRTLRDLRGCHIPILQSLYSKTCQKIHEETGVDPGQIIAYVHYPPSVYQLHVHFKHLVGPGTFHDTLRIHSLPSIINNLKIDSEYYAKSNLQLPVYVHTDLYLALGLDPTDIQKKGSNLSKSTGVQTFQTI
jgi:hypothetical protein